MADKTKKLKGNVPGPFYVDEQCLFCRACIRNTPAHFREMDGHSSVYRQPETEQEKALCQQVLADCPAEAIGNDGE